MELRPPPAFRLALWLTRHSPRGKGWFPRRIGRTLCRDMRLKVTTPDGIVLAVDPHDLDYFTKLLAEGGRLDRAVCEACIRLLEPGDVFFDVGAHAGVLSAEIAAHFGGRLRICAFEPQPRLARVAATTGCLNPGGPWDVFPVMVGARGGSSALFVPTSGYHASAVAREAGARALTCPVVTIDGLVARGIVPPPAVIKIDVEGAERDVLAGAARTIRRFHPALVLEADENMTRFGYTRADLLETVTALGAYEFFDVTDAGLRPSEAAADSGRDLVAVPAGGPVRRGMTSHTADATHEEAPRVEAVR